MRSQFDKSLGNFREELKKGADVFVADGKEVNRMLKYITKVQTEEAKKLIPPQLNYKETGRLFFEVGKKVEKARKEMEEALASARDGEHNQMLKDKFKKFEKLRDEQIRIGYWNKVAFDKELERRYQVALIREEKIKKKE